MAERNVSTSTLPFNIDIFKPFTTEKSTITHFLSDRESDTLEFLGFCLAQERIRLNPTNTSVLEEHCAPSSDPDEFKEEDLLQLFSIFMIFLLGVVVRVLLKRTNWNVPYTVVLMVLGFIVGQLSKTFCDTLHYYTAIARTKPEVILLTFLPVLIFESAFSISVHTFLRSATQIMIIALPGMIFSTFTTALISMYMMYDYGWSFIDASLFGSIISATDPVAVVAILRELGASETLSVVIEGESLLNDGVAVLLFEIFKEILEANSAEESEASFEDHLRPQKHHHDSEPASMVLAIFLKFLQIAVGGPIFGYFMAKLTILSLSKVYNDSTVEVSITIASAYLTYFIGEEVLGVSGIMAVVILGITLSSERTCISPESEKAVHHFWEMTGYLANTALFVLIGIIIGERAMVNVSLVDGAYLLVLYLVLNCVRGLMFLVLSPVLTRTGYGLEWRNVVIMTWGGLRGAVGLCLALEVYENPHLCSRKELGPKILFLTAGIVFLTLVINATFTKKLMEMLKMTGVSESRKADIQNAVKILQIKRAKELASLKQNRFVCDAEWKLVDEMTKLENPYGTPESTDTKSDSVETFLHKSRIIVSQILSGIQMIKTKCPVCENRKKANMTLLEYQELAEEARLRVLKALKISFWRQYQQGLIKNLAVQILITLCDKIEDAPFKMIGSRDLAKYWEPSLFFQSLLSASSSSVSPDFNGAVQKFITNTAPLRPPWTRHEQKSLKASCKWLSSQNWFHHLMDSVTFLSIVLSVVGILVEVAFPDKCLLLQPILIGLHIFISLVLGSELFIKIIALGTFVYFEDKWHYVDLFVLTLSAGDILLSALPCHLNDEPTALVLTLKALGLLQMLRLLKRVTVRCISRFIVPSKRIREVINRRGVERICLGYEIGKGFVTGVEQVFKLMPMMPDDTKSIQRLKGALEREKMEVIRELGKLQRKYPEVAMGAKTRHAARAVLNEMRQNLNEITEDGLIDEAESDILSKLLQKKMKQLSESPRSMIPQAPDSILENLHWVKDDPKLLEAIKSKATYHTLVPGDVLYTIGDGPKGIYVIVSGLIKIQYVPSARVITECKKFGVIPNSEILDDFSYTEKACDILSSGTVVGEVGYLKHQERAASVVCETFVSTYYLSYESLDFLSSLPLDGHDLSPMSEFWCSPFQFKLWKSWGFKVATKLFSQLPEYDDWSMERIQGYLERAVVPDLDLRRIIEIPDVIADILVIEGYFQNFDSMELYVAPCLIPSHCTRLISKKNPVTTNRLLMVPHEDVDLNENMILLTTSTLDLLPLSSSMISETFGKVDDFARLASFPMKKKKGSGDRLGVRQRRLSIAINVAGLGSRTSIKKDSREEEDKPTKE